MIPCPLYQIFHLQCPFCGVQRGLIALSEGDIIGWWNYNPVVWSLLPYFLILFVGELYKPWRDKPIVQFCFSNRAIFFVFGILIIWGILRNIV